ncbi:LamG-like jellyroll fold domain-containing protein [Nonomuraea lactucae]|uniref:LamG-like jellyroll fold domain-containing protein n=1 Tax=Nonomuraea lactucae TaxID=2249762 RepID=UPI0013B3B311|nr:LamG-like jellyroll fold domain-containing protein [Nonomuraea lactucae]
MAASLLVAVSIPQAAADPGPHGAKAGTAGPAVTTFPRPDDPDAPLRAAVAEARKQNKPVAVEAAFSESSRTWAYPDGHLSTDSYSRPAQLRQGDGSWAWMDPSLVEQGGVLRPRLAKAHVRVSAGGAGPFVTMTLDRDRSFGLSWPTALPRPQVKGNVATYVGAAGPSADLVVTALPTGFRHDIVLRERPSGPVEFRTPVQARGLKLTETKSGGLSLSTATGKGKGKEVASAPEPLMWDASAGMPTAEHPGRQASIDSEVETEDGATVLVLKPDAGWLADPATKYPVTVDPTTTLGVSKEVGIRSPNSQRSPGTVSRSHWKHCTGTTCAFEEQIGRTLMAFDTAPIGGRQVVKATMQMQLRSDVINCSEFQGIIAQRVTEAWVADDTFWGNQPASTEEGRSSIDPCSLPGTAGAVWSWDLTTMTRLWATGTANHGLVLRLAAETPVAQNYGEDFQFWPQMFTGGTPPKLSVDWVLPPELPTVTAESIDSMHGNDAIARSTNVKVTYKSSVPEATPLNYTVAVNDSTMAPPATELPAGEAALWKLDETSGASAADSSGKNVPATLTGAYTRIPGQLGQVVKFTGGHAATAKPAINTDQSFTATAWVRLDSSTTDQNVLDQMGVNQPGFTLAYHTSTAPEYDQRWELSMIREDVPDRIRETAVMSKDLAKIGEWTHLAAQYDKTAGKIRLYVDGVLVGERDHGVAWKAQGAFEIGRARALAGNLNGSVDDVHVYQRALTGNEIRALVGVPGTTTHNNIPSGQVLDKVFTLDNPASFKFVVKACRAGVNPPSCNESPAYRITSDAPTLPTDAETGMADPAQPILSGMVNRPSGGPVTAKYYLYDNTGAPVGSAPLGSRTVNGGQRASLQIPANTVQPGTAYKWQMVACAVGQQSGGTDPEPTPTPTPTPTPSGDSTPPAVSQTVPANGGRMLTSKPLSVTFSEPITGAQLAVKGVRSGQPDHVPSGTISMDSTNTVLTWTPSDAFVSPYTYTVTVTSAKDSAGNTLLPYTWSFLRDSLIGGSGDSGASSTTSTPSGQSGSMSENGTGALEEVCTSKTAPLSFTTPGTPPPPPVENVRNLTLGKDSFVIKTAKTNPTACNGGPCTLTDSTTMQIGGTGTDKTAAVVGFKLDELPDGAGVTEAVLKLGTPICPTGDCPTDATITVTPLKSPVKAESKGSELAGDADPDATPYSLPINRPQADVAGNEYRWLLFTSNKDEVISFGDSAAAEQPSLALTYLPAGPPSKVLKLNAQPGDASALASWGIPERTGSVALLDGYDVEVADPSGTVVKTLDVKDPYVGITGLTNGQAFTVNVRARSAYGTSDWESATVTPKAAPPPPPPGTPCIPFLDGEQPPAAKAAGGTATQAYVDLIKAYYQAQDAVLEGRADTIWDAPGVTALTPSTAKLSLLNEALISQRDELASTGKTRTGSTVEVTDPIVLAMPNGTVQVMAKIKRTWTEPSSTSGMRTASGEVEPSEATIDVHAFDRCGNMTIIQVPIDWVEDSTDHAAPPGAGGSAGYPAGRFEWVNWIGNLGRELDHKKKQIRPGKYWFTYAQSNSWWEQPKSYSEWVNTWKLKDVNSSLQVYPSKKSQWDSAYAKWLVSHMSLTVSGTVCVQASTTDKTTAIGLTLGTDSFGSWTDTFTTKDVWQCRSYSRTLGKNRFPKVDAGANWIDSICDNECGQKWYRHHTTANLTIVHMNKLGYAQEDHVAIDLEGKVKKTMPAALGNPHGSFSIPEYKRGGKIAEKILER